MYIMENSAPDSPLAEIGVADSCLPLSRTFVPDSCPVLSLVESSQHLPEVVAESMAPAPERGRGSVRANPSQRSMATARPAVASVPTSAVDAALRPDNMHLRPEDYAKIVDWLENPDNFNQLHGGNRRKQIGGKYPSKKTVFNMMLVVLHHVGFPKEITSGDRLSKRFDRYLRRYKLALAFKNDTGRGLSARDIARGISFEDKLNAKCPHFDRMHILYGERANIEPPALACVGLDDDTQSQLDDDLGLDDDGNDDNLDQRSPTFVYGGNVDSVLLTGT